MVQAAVAAPTSAVIQPAAANSIALSASEASIAAYLAAGERMRVLSGWVIVALLGIMLALIIGWATGLLPVAIRLF